MAEVRKYFVKSSWIFNLEAMHDKLFCIRYRIDDGELQFPITIANTVCRDDDDIQRLIDEASRLEWTAKSGRVTSKEYGRIKEMVEWRVMQRYVTCLESGMSEAKAGRCFGDM